MAILWRIVHNTRLNTTAFYSNYGANMFEQIAIALTGIIAIWLTQQSREEWKKYACLFGICGQPFWVYSTYQAEQWGIFVLTFFYTYSWILGFKNNWMNKSP